MERLMLIAGLTLACHAAAASGIAPDSMNGWAIVVADDAIASEKYAASEFQSLFRQATGIELPIVSAPPAPDHNIFIGHNAAMASSPVGFGIEKLGDEGLRIRIRKNNIAIAGGRPRGTLYGVYEFFERYFGVRFLTFDHTHFPDRASLKPLPRDNYSFVPPFSFRWSFYRENSEQPAFAARLRVNTVTNDEKLGGATPQGLIGHSLYKWINPELFGKTHPEYFALVGGERKLDVGGGGPEPCVTNPEVLDIVAEGVIKELDANPNVRNIPVSQNDNADYCRCDRCEAINKREGTPMGSHLAFINAVAERVEKVHPNVKVGTLAYWYTRRAPKTIKPRDNIQIQLCSIECCTLHALDDPSCRKNREFCRDMSAWKAICKDIWIWNYNTDFACYDLPFPNLRSIGANVRFFLKNNVKGVFMQANGNGTSGEMSDLRNYVMSRCLWHPGQESWPLVEEFCRLHYKESAQPILDYLTMLHDNAEKKKVHPGCFPTAIGVGLTPEVSQKAFDYFQDALAKAGSDEVRARIEKASICAYKAMILAGGGSWKYEDGVCKRQWSEPRFANIVDRYIELATRYRLTMAAETVPFPQYVETLKSQYGVPALRIENDTWRLLALPSANGRLIEMLHKPSGRNLIAGMTDAGLGKSSHEDIALKGYSDAKPLAFTGAIEGQSIVLAKTLEDGSTFERRIALDGDAIAFASKLTNATAQPKEYQFKAHPEFDAATNTADSDIVTAYIKDAEWKKINRHWIMDKGPDAGLLKQAQGGGFAFFNHKEKFGVNVSYDPAKIGEPYLFWNPEWSQINLELFTPAKELKPGESLSLEYTYRFLGEPPR
ncbi:MAG TPA: DUF4838 domain-containing protein [Candidatus Hydrogenedentes bacterium]|nr:DUF4838 domain-containing protein [Candidatus Hydrogenedentota bacterium]HRT18513.1 DUF4838 domain-containing protein [Candidatus Hydrogenedentota bacterium]HRT63532.1 DUF4838 domain-containing protein [Candidatus Hydrogenedentota bacterium]